MISVILPVQMIAVATAVILIGLCWISTESYQNGEDVQ